ncbi:MAG TPA: AI-2E family transporter [Burkholderiales bacterium]|nr:AI-2E family transporter [Burkholderiales bacterium]
MSLSPDPIDRPAATTDRKDRYFALKLPVHVRNVPLILISAFVVIYFLQWAKAFLIPLLLGILITYMLSPVVGWVERARIPRMIAALLVLFAFIGPAVTGAFLMADDAVQLLESLPVSVRKVATAMRGGRDGAMSRMQQVAKDLEQVAKGAPEPAPRGRTTTVQIEQPVLKLQDYVWSGSKSALAGMAQGLMVLFLVIFLLTSGDLFKRKLVRIIGDTLTEKKITVHILDEIDNQIQRYMLVLLVSNVLLGVMTWLTFVALGVEQAGAWGIAAGLLHVIPYFGPSLIAVATGLAGFMQFGTLPMAVAVAGSTLVISALLGMGLTTWMLGRASRMNSASVFVGLLFWGWIWGLWGLLLGIPILVIIKVISDHIEGLAPVAELLGE